MYNALVKYYEIDEKEENAVSKTAFTGKSCTLRDLGWIAENVYYHNKHAPKNFRARFCIKLSEAENCYGSVLGRKVNKEIGHATIVKSSRYYTL
jgi:hypothetical protein